MFNNVLCCFQRIKRQFRLNNVFCVFLFLSFEIQTTVVKYSRHKYCPVYNSLPSPPQKAVFCEILNVFANISLTIFRIFDFLNNLFPMHFKEPPFTPFSPNIKRASTQNALILGFSHTLLLFFIHLGVLKTYMKKKILFTNDVLVNVLISFSFSKLLF